MEEKTSFNDIYNRFFGKITDDMYVTWTKEDTEQDVHNILIDAIPGFEFPRFQLYNYNENGYNIKLTSEEINILALLMCETWLQRQINSIDIIRMGYSGYDFKMSSQANHLDKLTKLLAKAKQTTFHMQRLYKRRISDEEGYIKSDWKGLGGGAIE